MRNEKEEIKLSLFTNDMNIYLDIQKIFRLTIKNNKWISKIPRKQESKKK